MEIQYFFDEETSTLTYVVFDKSTGDAVIIDPIMDYDCASSTICDHSFKLVLTFLQENKLTPHFVLETHAHADHLSGAQLFKKVFPHLKVAISKKIQKVQSVFHDILNLEKSFACDGSQFEKLIEEDEIFSAGSLTIKAIATPGHTPACISYLIGDSLFCGDTLFIEDYGTGRCDFPEGSATDLYHSVHVKLYALSDATEVYVGHDYQPNNRELRYKTTIGASKTQNIQLKKETTRDAFITFRENRDKTLKTPKLLFASIQVNIRAGHLPPAEREGKAFLKIPLYREN